jgi:hypothetical protein
MLCAAVRGRDRPEAVWVVGGARTVGWVGGRADAAHADYSQALQWLAQPTPELYLERAALPLPADKILAGLDEGLARLGPVVALSERALALEVQLGRTDAAVARLDALAVSAERKETWLKRRGDLLAAAGRTAAAHASYRAALDAIRTLPAWLRDMPETVALAATLSRLTSPQS